MPPRSSLAEQPQPITSDELELAELATEVPLTTIFTGAITHGRYDIAGEAYRELMPTDDPAMVRSLLHELTTALRIERQRGEAEHCQRLSWGIQALLWPKQPAHTEPNQAGYAPVRVRAIQRSASQASMAADI